jgi:hypothetical protein
MLIRYLNTVRPKLKIKLLVGHSNGNLLVSSALNHIENELINVVGGAKYRNDGLGMQNLAVVAFGAVVNLPVKLVKPENQHQFLGDLDLLGRTNSRSLGGVIDNGVKWI